MKWAARVKLKVKQHLYSYRYASSSMRKISRR